MDGRRNKRSKKIKKEISAITSWMCIMGVNSKNSNTRMRCIERKIKRWFVPPAADSPRKKENTEKVFNETR
jgi:hypothetical protein